MYSNAPATERPRRCFGSVESAVAARSISLRTTAVTTRALSVVALTTAALALFIACTSRADNAHSQGDPGCPSLPRFDRAVRLEQTAETSANVSFGDLTGSGNLDLVLAKGRHWPLISRVLINDGHGGFPTAHNLSGTPYRSFSAVLADVNGDGFLDVVLGNDFPDPKVIYLNDGKGNFTLGSSFGKPGWPTRNVAVADLNRDGWPDIIVANRFPQGTGSNYVCLNHGQGRFDADCIAFSHEPATTITPADFNGDGFMDLVVPNRDGGQSYVYLNDHTAHFPKRIPFGPPNVTIRMAVVADLTGSGRPDIVTIDERHGTFIYYNQPDGTFSRPAQLGTVKVSPYALAVGDLNRDGHTDIVVGYVNAPSIVYFNTGQGRSFTPVPFGDNRGTAYGIAIGDLDKDGWPDIAVARSDAPNVAYFSSGAVQCRK